MIPLRTNKKGKRDGGLVSLTNNLIAKTFLFMSTIDKLFGTVPCYQFI